MMTMRFMSLPRSTALFLLTSFFLFGFQSTGQDGKPLTTAEIMQKRAATIEMSKAGLDTLIKQKPSVRKEIDEAAGYAVFTTTNVNIVLLVVVGG
jgi:hypothetical protein